MGKSHIHIIVSSEMKAEIEADARRQHMTKSAFIRQLYLMHKQYLSERESQLSAKRSCKKTN